MSTDEKKKRLTRRVLAGVLVLALAVRVAFAIYFWHERVLPVADQYIFDDMALNLLAGKGLSVCQWTVEPLEGSTPEQIAKYYSHPERARDNRLQAVWGVIRPGVPTTFFPPLTSLVLAGTYLLLGHSFLWFRLLLSILGVCVCLMVFLIGRDVIGSSFAGMVGAFLCAFYPLYVCFTVTINTQTMALFFLMCIMWLHYKVELTGGYGWAVCLGSAFGLGFLNNPVLLPFMGLSCFCSFLALRGVRRFVLPVLTVMTCLLFIIPWVARNYRVTGGEWVVLPTKGGRNLWEQNNQKFSTDFPWREPVGIEVLYYNLKQKHVDSLNRPDLVEFPEFTDETETERNRVLGDNVKEFLVANPVVALKLFLIRSYALFRVESSHHLNRLYSLIAWLSTGWILPAGAVGFVLCLKYLRRLLFLYMACAAYIGVHVLMVAGIPYRFPLDALFCLMAGVTIGRLLMLLGLKRLVLIFD